MRKTALLVTGLALGLIGLTGCYDNSSSTGVLFSAYNSVEKGNLHDLRAVLDGDALTSYGSAAGMAALKAKFAGMSNMSLGQATILSGQEGSAASYQYSLEAIPAGQKDYVVLGTAEVDCTWSTASAGFDVPMETRCMQNTEFENCTISEIELN